MISCTIKRLKTFIDNSRFDGVQISSERFIEMNRNWLAQFPETAQVLYNLENQEDSTKKLYPHQALVKIYSILTNPDFGRKPGKPGVNVLQKYHSIVLFVNQNNRPLREQEFKSVKDAKEEARKLPATLKYSIVDYRYRTPIKIC